MIILTPFDPDKEIDFSDLHQIKRVKWLAKNLPECKDHFREFNALSLEQDLWNHTHYIEDICATSAHQEVNIYTQATKRYEIRFDESAMDVQVKSGSFVNNFENTFFTKLKILDSDDNWEQSLDTLNNFYDDLLIEEKYEQCDAYITEFLKHSYSLLLYEGLLTITNRRKKHLPARRELYEATKAKCLQQNMTEEQTKNQLRDLA